MILTARLHIKEHEFENDGIALEHCSYSFSQEVDERGLPVSEVYGGLITLSFQSLDDQAIMYWMMSPDKDRSGKIVFASEEKEKVFKTVAFKDARCIAFKEEFSRNGDFITEITISAREITISEQTHKNTWTKYNPGK